MKNIKAAFKIFVTIFIPKAAKIKGTKTAGPRFYLKIFYIKKSQNFQG